MLRKSLFLGAAVGGGLLHNHAFVGFHGDVVLNGRGMPFEYHTNGIYSSVWIGSKFAVTGASIGKRSTVNFGVTAGLDMIAETTGFRRTRPHRWTTSVKCLGTAPIGQEIVRRLQASGLSSKRQLQVTKTFSTGS